MPNTYDTSIKPLAAVTSASNGIGHELAKQLAKHGHDLLIVAENPSIVEIAEELKDYGIDAISLQLDLATHEGVDLFHKKIIAMGRPIEVMVINQLNDSSFSYLATHIIEDMLQIGAGRILFHSPAKDDFVQQLREKIVGTNITITTFAVDIDETKKNNDELALAAQEVLESLMSGADHVTPFTLNYPLSSLVFKKTFSLRE